jgi:hypothetical protein
LLCWPGAPIMNRLSTRGGVSPHPVRAYALAPSTDAPQCTLLQQQGISHLSCSLVTRVHPRSPTARAFRRAAARCGFASMVVVPCIRPGTVRGLGCGVNAANILPGCAPPAWRGSSRLWVVLAVPLLALVAAARVSGVSHLAFRLLVRLRVHACNLWLAMGGVLSCTAG